MMLSPALTRFGKVEAISAGRQPKKVWKHFHDPAEHWERLAGQDLTGLRLEAEELVGVLRFDQRDLPDLSGQRKRRAHEALRRHHDDHYGPIYLTELSSHETCWACDAPRLPAPRQPLHRDQVAVELAPRDHVLA
jgi:hypothetical protein